MKTIKILMLSSILALASCSSNESYIGEYLGQCSVSGSIQNKDYGDVYIEVFEDSQGAYILFNSLSCEIARLYDVRIDLNSSGKGSLTMNNLTLFNGEQHDLDFDIKINNNQLEIKGKLGRCVFFNDIFGGYDTPFGVNFSGNSGDMVDFFEIDGVLLKQ